MSFVEKNKAWLLPLLGLGVGAVVYLNLQTLSPKAAPPTPSLQPGPALPAPGPALPPPGPAPAPQAAGATGDLWSDLLALATPPAALAQEPSLRERCRQTLGSLLVPPPAPRLPRPGWVREAEPVRAASQASPVVAPPAVLPPPVVEFIVSGPDGATAWIKGRPYHVGEAIPGGPYTVASIQWNRVGLSGPKGSNVIQFMNRSNHPLAGTRPSAEAP